ncbi:MAG: metallophosphoesterase [Armatimonadetes bacterium]|nr:metallophosphoesterase [Armatimonadota bacterium]
MPDTGDGHDSGAPRSPARRRFFAAAMAAAMAAVPADALWLEPIWPQVTLHTVPLPGLPSSCDGLTLLQLSDFHLGPTVSEEEIARAVRLANRIQPDVVVLTGDYVHPPARAGALAAILGRLRSRLGVFAVPGNHDHWEGVAPILRALRGVGIREMTNTNVLLAPGLRLAGIDDIWCEKDDLARAHRGCRAGEALVLLSHSPLALPLAARAGVAALCLAGHTHGGQIRMPFVRPTWIPGLRGRPYVAGWYAEGRSRMYVNRGIGTIGLRLRFRCRPEIALFTLRSL